MCAVAEFQGVEVKVKRQPLTATIEIDRNSFYCYRSDSRDMEEFLTCISGIAKKNSLQIRHNGRAVTLCVMAMLVERSMGPNVVELW